AATPVAVESLHALVLASGVGGAGGMCFGHRGNDNTPVAPAVCCDFLLPGVFLSVCRSGPAPSGRKRSPRRNPLPPLRLCPPRHHRAALPGMRGEDMRVIAPITPPGGHQSYTFDRGYLMQDRFKLTPSAEPAPEPRSGPTVAALLMALMLLLLAVRVWQ